MKLSDANLVTPIYLKTGTDMPWPEEPVFYQVTADGLFLCRNHAFFRSSVATKRWPAELAEHGAFLQLRYPKLSRRYFELVIGFFDRIAELHGSEAAVLLCWDRAARRVLPLIPDQLAGVSRSWRGRPHALDVQYEVPTELPAELAIIGDIHSHVDGPAYASGVDKDDEVHRPGLHMVVGRISREPPELHIEAVVDAARFHVAPHLVIEGYRRRRLGVPQFWLDRVKIKRYKSWWDDEEDTAKRKNSANDSRDFKSTSSDSKNSDSGSPDDTSSKDRERDNRGPASGSKENGREA